MNRFTFPGTLLCTIVIVLFVSSSGMGQKNSSHRSDDPTTTFRSDTTPQFMIMTAWHRVSNFATWKASYEAHNPMRIANGLHSYVIGRGVKDSNMVLVAVKVDDMAKAKAFAKDPSLKQAMQEGGVIGTPTFSFSSMVFQDTTKVTSDIRSMTTLTVNNWDAWKRTFESRKQVRMENGLMDRAYGYDPDDHRKVTVVMVVLDTAKAQAYWNSDMLRRQRSASGVVGVPERFVFRVVQRY